MCWRVSIDLLITYFSAPGRVFNSSPKLKTTKTTFVRRGFTAGTRPAPPKSVPKAATTNDDIPPLEPIRPKSRGQWTAKL